MALPTDSFKKFNYWLRPSKQVERKIMIEILLSAMQSGYDIRKYTYFGFGSVYYADFVMFHKYLYINDMICIEWSDVRKRMKFNLPYEFITLRMSSLQDALPKIVKKRTKYLAWVDFDRQLDADMLRDIDDCILTLPMQSIFIVTVDARARVPRHIVESNELTPKQQDKWLLKQFNEEFGLFVERKIVAKDLDDSEIPGLYYDAIIGRINETIRVRDGAEFIQFFNFLYADGAPMLTIGGMIGTAEDREKMAVTLNHEFAAGGREPVLIKVPHLTFREKQWLDSNLQCDKACFELDDDGLENYRRFYRQYPTFVESLT